MNPVSILEAILGLAKVAPDLAGAAKAFYAWLMRVSGNDPEKFLKQSSQIFIQLSQAKTQDERYEAAKAIADLIHSLPSQ